MDIITLSAVAIASAVNAAVPGPCVALTIGRSARGGLTAGFLVTLGLAAADLILCGVALSIMLGLLTLSPTVYVVMKWAGIAVLVTLGIRMLSSSGGDRDTKHRCERQDFRDVSAGLAMGLSSPFNLVFLLALLPQMVPTTDLSVATVGAITLAVMSGAALSMTASVLIGGLSGSVLQGAGRQIERFGALSIFGFAGVAIATPIA